MEENKHHYGWIIGFFGVLLVLSYMASAPTTPLPSPILESATSTREGWLQEQGNQFTFLYPADFDTEYISPVDWPPVGKLIPQPFTCSSAGVPGDRAGGTRSRIIENKEFCITEVVEGAAGSTYTQRAYAFAYGTSTATLTFTTRHPQCANYSDPERGLCEAEQNFIDLDVLVKRMVDTISLVPDNN